VGHFANKDGNNEAWDGGGRVGQSHKSTGVVGSDVNVIGEEATVHSGDEHGAEGHESNSSLTITSGKTDSDEAQSRKKRS
jgi:hypothetical protein